MKFNHKLSLNPVFLETFVVKFKQFRIMKLNKLYRFAKDNIHVILLCLEAAIKVNMNIIIIDGEYPIIMQWGQDTSSGTSILLDPDSFSTPEELMRYLWTKIEATNV